MGRQRCSTFMVSRSLPSVRGDGDGREKREKALSENVGREKVREKGARFFHQKKNLLIKLIFF